MTTTFNSADQVVQAAAVAPGFSSTFSKAPAQVTYKGKTYQRSAARNAQEKVWYLAALAITKPSAVASLAYAGYDSALELDADRTALDAAKATLRTAEGDLRAKQAVVASDKQKVASWKAKLQTTLNPADGKPWIGQLPNYYLWQGQVNAFEDHLTNEAEPARKLAQAAAESARKDVDAEQEAYTVALKAQRKQAEDERLEKLRNSGAEATALEMVSADAAARQATAEQATVAQQENQEPPIDYSGEMMGSGEDTFGQSEWLDTELSADVTGDEDYAQYAGEDSGELEGESSPYSYRKYYGCDEDLEHFCPAGLCSQGWDTMEEKGYGLEPNIIMAIIAAILAIAPIIIGALMPPPAAADSAENSGAADKTAASNQSVAAQVAQLTGADKLLKDAADRAGAGAKPDLTVPALILAAALLLG